MKFISLMFAVAIVAALVYFGLNQLAPPQAATEYASAADAASAASTAPVRPANQATLQPTGHVP